MIEIIVSFSRYAALRARPFGQAGRTVCQGSFCSADIHVSVSFCRCVAKGAQLLGQSEELTKKLQSLEANAVTAAAEADLLVDQAIQ